jgi:hypothetical protein
MTDKWLTVNEIAELLSRTKARIKQRAKLESWPYRSYKVRGGKGRRYNIASLPEDVQAAYAASIKLSLADLQSRFKADLPPEKKADIPGYNGHSKPPKAKKNVCPGQQKRPGKSEPPGQGYKGVERVRP